MIKSRVLPPRLSAALVLITALSSFAPTQGQPQGQEKKPGKDQPPSASPSGWGNTLDQLFTEARTLEQEETRPILIAEIADTYWDLDKTRSSELFTAALDASLSLKDGTKGASSAIRNVIKLAAQRDILLAKQLNEKALEHLAKSGRPGNEFVTAAVDLLKTDPQGAAQLLIANVRTGPSMDVAWSIMELSNHDPKVAEQVYRAYLAGFAGNQSLGLNRLLWLCGYPFGHGEAFGGSDPTNLSGFSGLRVKNLAPNPALAASFIDITFRVIQRTLKQAPSEPPAKGIALYGTSLFAITYLLPEVRLYRADAAEAWQLLHQRALAGTPDLQREIIAKRIQGIFEIRARVSKSEGGQTNPDDPSQSSLERAEKLPEGCERDREYVKVALKAGSTREFPRALEIAERIKDTQIRESVTQFIYYDISRAAVENGDLDEARKYADRVNSPEQRSVLYVRLANKALRDNERARAWEALTETKKLAGGVESPSLQTSILLAAAAGFADFDPAETYVLLKEAIKAINKGKNHNVDKFQILRRVDLTCRSSEPSWFGDSDRAERFSLIETLASLTGSDSGGAMVLAQSLEDAGTRIRALTSVVRAAIKSEGSLDAPRLPPQHSQSSTSPL